MLGELQIVEYSLFHPDIVEGKKIFLKMLQFIGNAVNIRCFVRSTQRWNSLKNGNLETHFCKLCKTHEAPYTRIADGEAPYLIRTAILIYAIYGSGFSYYGIIRN